MLATARAGRAASFRGISLVLAGGLFFSGLARADQALVRAVAESNVNQQYVVESVSLAGVEVTHYRDSRLSPTLRRRLSALVGVPCDMTTLSDLAEKLRTTLHLQEVTQRLTRGSSPDRVRVNFEFVRPEATFDLSVPRFLYSSNQGWTAEVNARMRLHEQSLTAGFGSNGDDLVERFTGFSTRYEDGRLFSSRLKFAVGIEGYHDLWNPATRRAVLGEESQTGLNGLAADASKQFALYRSRRNIEPTLTLALTRELSLSVGASFESMEMEAPSPVGGDASKSANAATGEVNFGYTREGTDNEQRWDAKYSVRVATRQLGSDYVYRRQTVSVRYGWKHGKHMVTDRVTAGTIRGNAPLFERFVLGNSSTLFGWDRYEIDPLGGSRMAHNSVSYGRQIQGTTAEVFYDAGVVGEGDKLGTLRHSVGFGVRQGIFNIAMAFPLFEGRVAAVFMAGMNY
jgi:hypothetical protein